MTPTQAQAPKFTVKCGYDRTGKTINTYRNPVDIAEMLSWCSTHDTIEFLSTDGYEVVARRAKVNGKVRIWKRDKERIEVPVKYGLYEYGTFDATDISRVLIPVQE